MAINYVQNVRVAIDNLVWLIMWIAVWGLTGELMKTSNHKILIYGVVVCLCFTVFLFAGDWLEPT